MEMVPISAISATSLYLQIERPNPGHVEKLSLRSVFFNTFFTFAIITFVFTFTSLYYNTYCPVKGGGGENLAKMGYLSQNSISKVRDGNAGELVAQGK